MNAPQWAEDVQVAILNVGRWQANVSKIRNSTAPSGARYLVIVGGPTDEASPPATVNWTTFAPTMLEGKRVALAAIVRLQKAWP